MPKANELKAGMIVEVKGQPYIVKQVQANNPSARGAATLYKIRFNHAQTGQKLDESSKGDEQYPNVDFQKRQVQFLYQDSDGYTFMDNEDYSQHLLSTDQLIAETPYLTDGLSGITALIIDDICVGIDLPTIVEMEIVETPPAMKAASASARNKPAKLPTGLEVQVPEYLTSGEVIKINTGTGEFVSRA